MSGLDPVAAAAVAATFLLAGTVKGVVGLGLPTVSLGLLTAAFDLTTAMALMIVPSFATNLWQAVVGGGGRPILGRTWPFLLTATATVWLGAVALTRLDLALLSGLLGAVILAYGALGVAGLRFAIPARREIPAGLLLGAANGILTGMTGSFVVPGVMYLQGLGLPRDRLVQAMGISFTASTVALALALGGNGLLSSRLWLASGLAVVPACAGMALGQGIRRRLPEERFRRVFFVAIVLLGAYIAGEAVTGAGIPATNR